jgi:hypothetical protein
MTPVLWKCVYKNLLTGINHLTKRIISLLTRIHRPLQASLFELRPDKALKAQSTQSRFFFSLSAERPRIGGMTILFQRFKGWPPESEKQQPCGQNSTVSVKDTHRSSNGMHIPPKSGCGFSFAASLPCHSPPCFRTRQVSGK